MLTTAVGNSIYRIENSVHTQGNVTSETWRLYNSIAFVVFFSAVHHGTPTNRRIHISLLFTKYLWHCHPVVVVIDISATQVNQQSSEIGHILYSIMSDSKFLTSGILQGTLKSCLHYLGVLYHYTWMQHVLKRVLTNKCVVNLKYRLSGFYWSFLTKDVSLYFRPVFHSLMEISSMWLIVAHICLPLVICIQQHKQDVISTNGTNIVSCNHFIGSKPPAIPLSLFM